MNQNEQTIRKALLATVRSKGGDPNEINFLESDLSPMVDDSSRGPSESSDRVVNLAIEEIVKCEGGFTCAARNVNGT